MGGTPRTQEAPSPMGKQPPPRSDFLMLSTERDGERQTETRSETETERQAGREAERKAPLSRCETPQECTQGRAARVQVAGPTFLRLVPQA